MFEKNLGVKVIRVNAAERYFRELKGVSDPEPKRKIIGRLFIEIFDEEAAKLTGVDFLAQGTIYPDVIESAGGKTGKAHVIKSHHNVGGLPAHMKLKLVEPLRELFKDEVRRIGVELGLPAEMVYRHPFPGPGLGVRILGEVTQAAAETLRHADHIFIEELRKAGWYEKTSQAFAVFLPVKSVGVTGDGRRHDPVIALRAVETIDFMTAHWAHLPYELLGRVLDADRERSEGRVAGGLRHQREAAGDDRVGVSLLQAAHLDVIRVAVDGQAKRAAPAAAGDANGIVRADEERLSDGLLPHLTVRQRDLQFVGLDFLERSHRGQQSLFALFLDFRLGLRLSKGFGFHPRCGRRGRFGLRRGLRLRASQRVVTGHSRRDVRNGRALAQLLPKRVGLRQRDERQSNPPVRHAIPRCTSSAHFHVDRNLPEGGEKADMRSAFSPDYLTPDQKLISADR